MKMLSQLTNWLHALESQRQYTDSMWMKMKLHELAVVSMTMMVHTLISFLKLNQQSPVTSLWILSNGWITHNNHGNTYIFSMITKKEKSFDLNLKDWLTELYHTRMKIINLWQPVLGAIQKEKLTSNEHKNESMIHEDGMSSVITVNAF